MFGLFKPKQPKNTSEIDEDNVDEDKIIDDKNAIDVNICKKCNTYIVKGEKHKCK